MKLGLSIGYSRAHLDIPVKLVQRAEELGYDSVWTAEAYGSDAVTPLAFLAAHTKRIRLGTGIMQLAARTPANAAMSAATVDALAGGGRFIAGLGVSGPQIVEGWYGQPWGKPYWRMRDYVAIMRKIFAREAPVTHDGKRDLAALHRAGRHGHRQAAEVDPAHEPRHPDLSRDRQRDRRSSSPPRSPTAGCRWASCPGAMDEYRPWLEEGFRRAGNGKSLKDFAITASVHVEVDERREGRARQAEAGRRALCRRHGPQDQELPQRHHGAPRLRRRRQAHPGALPRRSQGRGDRRRARRMGRHEVAGRPAGPHPRALPRLGGLRRRHASACARASPRRSRSWRRPPDSTERASTEGVPS